MELIAKNRAIYIASGYCHPSNIASEIENLSPYIHKPTHRVSIQKLRALSGMSRQEFADYFGIPRGTLRNWEQGVRTTPQYIIDFVEKTLVYENKIEPSDLPWTETEE